MDLQLTGKTAIILAASKGLGKAIATMLASEGADIVIGARHKEELEKTALEIRAKAGGKVLSLPVDVGHEKELKQIVELTIKTFGKIDILVNNAGGPPFGKFESFDDQAWQAAFELNLLSFVRASRLVLPHMRKTGNGRIINITSLSVKTFLEGSVLSTSMRLGVVGLAKMLSAEMGPDKITVNNIAPGFILTDRLKETLFKNKPPGLTEEALVTERAREIPLRRMGQPEEVAALACFLSSPLAAYITGTTIPVDGGAVKAIY
jgi:3-oxoacyl-[acyl-carrier protein] reductase